MALEEAWKNARIYDCVEAFPTLIAQGASVEYGESCGEGTPLSCAAYESNAKTVRALLDHGADPSRAFGDPPRCAADEAITVGWAAGLKMLLEAGADLDGPHGPGGLAKAAMNRVFNVGALPEILNVLQRAGADLARPGLRAELLAEAATKDSVEGIQWLDARGADPREAPPGGGPSAAQVAKSTPRLKCSGLIEAMALRRDLAERTPAPELPTQQKARI